jgi:hypothetical protein
MQTTAPYSPDQLLDAGRRAEAQGQIGYALQFYRYLAEQHAQTAEGLEAREALVRLSTPAATGAPRQAAGGAPPSGPPQARPPVGDLRAVRPEPPAGVQPEARPRRSPTAATPAALRQGEVDEAAVVLPATTYRIGRFVAGLLNTVGWLLLIAAILAVPTIVAGLTVRSLPRGLRDVITGNSLMLGGLTFGALLIGLFAIFAAQVARATFDTAEAVRWLIAKSET